MTLATDWVSCSWAGIRTARKDIELIHERLKLARQDYEVRYGNDE